MHICTCRLNNTILERSPLLFLSRTRDRQVVERDFARISIYAPPQLFCARARWKFALLMRMTARVSMTVMQLTVSVCRSCGRKVFSMPFCAMRARKQAETIAVLKRTKKKKKAIPLCIVAEDSYTYIFISQCEIRVDITFDFALAAVYNLLLILVLNQANILIHLSLSRAQFITTCTYGGRGTEKMTIARAGLVMQFIVRNYALA